MDIERLARSGCTQVDQIVADDGFAKHHRHQLPHGRAMCDPSERHTFTHRLPKETQIRNHLKATAATRHDTVNSRICNFVHFCEVR